VLPLLSAPHHRVSDRKHPAIANTAVNPGVLFGISAVVPSAAGVVVFTASGFFVGAGVTLSSGGASAAVAVADGVGAFVAVTVGAGVPNHPGGYVPSPPPVLPPNIPVNAKEQTTAHQTPPPHDAGQCTSQRRVSLCNSQPSKQAAHLHS